ncbi:unnamed protein product, partial [Prorocentrum cordatum]
MAEYGSRLCCCSARRGREVGADITGYNSGVGACEKAKRVHHVQVVLGRVRSRKLHLGLTSGQRLVASLCEQGRHWKEVLTFSVEVEVRYLIPAGWRGRCVRRVPDAATGLCTCRRQTALTGRPEAARGSARQRPATEQQQAPTVLSTRMVRMGKLSKGTIASLPPQSSHCHFRWPYHQY